VRKGEETRKETREEAMARAVKTPEGEAYGRKEDVKGSKDMEGRRL
jgi:hypothetical protein